MNELDPTKPVQQRSGLKAKIELTDLNSTSFPIVARIEHKGGKNETVETYTKDGRFSFRSADDPRDLVNIPEPQPLTEEERRRRMKFQICGLGILGLGLLVASVFLGLTYPHKVYATDYIGLFFIGCSAGVTLERYLQRKKDGEE